MSYTKIGADAVNVTEVTGNTGTSNAGAAFSAQAAGEMQKTIVSDLLGKGEIIGGTVTCSSTTVSGDFGAIGAVKNSTTNTNTGLVAVAGATNIRFVLDTLKSQSIDSVVLRDYKSGNLQDRDRNVKNFKLYTSNGVPALTFGNMANLTHVSDNILLEKMGDIVTVQEFAISKACRYIVLDVVDNYGATYTGLRTFNARLNPTKEYSTAVEAANEADLYNPYKTGVKITVQNPIKTDTTANIDGDKVTYSDNLYYKYGFSKQVIKYFTSGGFEPNGGLTSAQTPAFVIYMFGTAKPVNGVRINCTMPLMQPSQFKIYGSMDGTSWTEVFSRNSYMAMEWREWKTLWFTGTHTYKYWKIEQTEARTTVYSEIEFLHKTNLQTTGVTEDLDVANKKYVDAAKQELSEAIIGIKTTDSAGTVATYADLLTIPNTADGDIWEVSTTTGVKYINLKQQGYYKRISDTQWERSTSSANRVAATDVEIASGTLLEKRWFSPADLKLAAQTHGGGGGGSSINQTVFNSVAQNATVQVTGVDILSAYKLVPPASAAHIMSYANAANFTVNDYAKFTNNRVENEPNLPYDINSKYAVGNRNAIIIPEVSASTNLFAGGNVSLTVNEKTLTHVGDTLFFRNNLTVSQHWAKYKMDTGVVFSRIVFNQQLADAQGTWVFEGSYDNSAWHAVTDQIAITTKETVFEVKHNNTDKFLWYRFRGVSGTTNSAGYMYGIRFFTHSANAYDSTKYAEITTKDSAQLDLSNFTSIDSVGTNMMIYNDVRFFYSFDGRQTWQRHNGTSFATVDPSTNIALGNTQQEIKTRLANWTPSMGTTLDIKAYMKPSASTGSYITSLVINATDDAATPIKLQDSDYVVSKPVGTVEGASIIKFKKLSTGTENLILNSTSGLGAVVVPTATDAELTAGTEASARLYSIPKLITLIKRVANLDNNQTTFRSWQGTQNSLLYAYLGNRVQVGMNGSKPRIKIMSTCEGTLIKMRCETFIMENSTTYVPKVGSSIGFQSMQKDQDYYPQLDSSVGFSLVPSTAYELPRKTGLYIQLSVKHEVRIDINVTRDFNDDWEMQVNAIKF